jgi:hypothetical protein
MTIRFKRLLACYSGVFLVTCCLVLHAAIPAGWHLEGTKPADYEVNVDPQAVDNHHRATVLLRSKKPVVEGFGTMMQQFRADNYLGKRIRLRGSLKADEVQGWAGLWMRVNKGKLVVGFDNMQARAVRGTQGWQDYEIVLDVPSQATDISFGVLLNGSGSVWLSRVRFETVGYYVPTTGPGGFPQEMQQISKFQFPQGPANLNFDN